MSPDKVMVLDTMKSKIRPVGEQVMKIIKDADLADGEIATLMLMLVMSYEASTGIDIRSGKMLQMPKEQT